MLRNNFMKHNILSFTFCLLFSQLLWAQTISSTRKIGLIGYGTIGYKSSVSGMALPAIGFWFTDHVELRFSYAQAGFTNSGFSSGIKLNFLTKNKFFVSGECSFRRLFAGKIVTDWNRDEEYVEYYVGNCNSIIPQLGINYCTGSDPDGILKAIVATFNLDCVFPLNTISPQYIRGTPGTPASSAWFEKTINRLYRKGLGFSIVVSFYLQRPVKNKSH